MSVSAGSTRRGSEARVFGAVDLGASGGRVMAGVVDGGHVGLTEVHRFANAIVDRDGHLRWDIRRLYAEVIVGLTALAERFPEAESIGIDTWGVDYALLDSDGDLIADPIAYRDPRTSAAVDEVHAAVPFEELFAITGIQMLPINTIYQLATEVSSPRWSDTASVVLLPDLIAFWLTGTLRTEVTNASTTALIDVATRTWSTRLLDVIGVDPAVFAPFDAPGSRRGTLRADVRASTGLSGDVVVTTVGSHDTASAVAAVPMDRRRAAYVSCGTWSLVGVELDDPLVTDAVRLANFTNEFGVADRTRFLRNVGGLWLLQESLRAWAAAGTPVDLVEVLALAAQVPDGGPTVDVDAAEFVAPGDMPARIHAAVGRKLDPAATTRCVVDSLAVAFATTIDQAARLADVSLDTVHVVGGGSRNTLLCRRIAAETGIPVVAGPADATALGNIVVQAHARGALAGTIDDARVEIGNDQELRRYRPDEIR